MAITPQDLENARRAVEQAQQPYRAAIEARQQLMRQALSEGMRGAHVARHAGVSRQAVSKLRDWAGTTSR